MKPPSLKQKISAFETGIKKSKKAGATRFRIEASFVGKECVVKLYHTDKKGKEKRSVHRFPDSLIVNHVADIVHKHNVVPGR